MTEVTLYPSQPSRWPVRGYLFPTRKTFGLRMRVRSAISTLTRLSCSCSAALGSDKIGVKGPAIRKTKFEALKAYIIHSILGMPKS